MTLSDLSIRRPVFAWMLMAALIIFGAISMGRLGVSQMPDYDFPVLTVNVQWPGTAPELIESEIVDRIESALMGIDKVRDLTSTIRPGSANITVEFEMERDVDAAMQDVQSRLSAIRMPKDVDPPTVRKSNPDDFPIMFVALSGKRSLRQLMDYVDNSLKDEIQTIPGVGDMTFGGYVDRNLRIWIDNTKLRARDLTVMDIAQAVQAEHFEASAGVIENEKNLMTVRTLGEAPTPEALMRIPINRRGGKPIFEQNIVLGDIARVENGLADRTSAARIDGNTAVGFGIMKVRGENAVAVGKRVRAKVDEINKVMPKDLNLKVNADFTVFVEQSVEETQRSLLLAALVTALVCFLFLGTWNSGFNVLLSIPTSIMGTFIVIYFMGFTLNMFTLLALALAVGIVVDDAIMVLENIIRHLHMGKDRVQASLDGAREITFAAVAASTAVIAIFLPVAFMSGIIGKFFFQFGVTLSAAVALSLLEAITLTPMRTSQLLTQGARISRMERASIAVFDFLSRGYRKALGWALGHRLATLLGGALIFALSIGISFWGVPFLSGKFAFAGLRTEMIPTQDQGIFSLRLLAPPGTSLTSMIERSVKVEEYLKGRPEVSRVYVAVGGSDSSSGFVFVNLVPKDKRKKGQVRIMDEVRKDLSKLKDVRVVVQDPSMRGFTSRRSYPVEFNIRGAEWSVLAEKADKIMARMKTTGLVQDVDSDYRTGMPEVRVTPNRNRAAQASVSMLDIGNTIDAAIGGIRVGKFTEGGRRFDVKIRLEAQERKQATDIGSLQIRTPYDQILTLRDLSSIEVKPSVQTLTRRGRQRSINITANMVTGKSQTEAIAAATKIAKEELPEGYRTTLSGGSQAFTDSFKSLGFVMLLGLIIAYMILASQFNSFAHPVTVLLALPFSVSGAFLALLITGQSLSLYSMIGIILLLGIVKKNSILLVEFANRQREEGLDPVEAMLKAGPIRLRPILMTSFATIAAAIPPALLSGPGSETRIPMSMTVIGGVLVSTLFTLFVVPCAYGFTGRKHKDPPAATQVQITE
ncbi:MAG: efflux RND transporter permease subunit [Spirochaetes bacterium]|nr:efflux RND transporter permease subunit [Spirochaetota bacterium]